MLIEGAYNCAKYGALCCVGTATEDKIDGRDTIQNMDGKREPSSPQCKSCAQRIREFECDYLSRMLFFSEIKTICSTVNFGQEVGSSFHVKCTAIDYFCLAFPFCVCENEDCENA